MHLKWEKKGRGAAQLRKIRTLVSLSVGVEIWMHDDKLRDRACSCARMEPTSVVSVRQVHDAVVAQW